MRGRGEEEGGVGSGGRGGGFIGTLREYKVIEVLEKKLTWKMRENDLR